MVAISVYDEKEIDTTSDEVRNKIAESVAKHI